jgi:pyruvate-formate lyase-activating enzyme
LEHQNKKKQIFPPFFSTEHFCFNNIARLNAFVKYVVHGSDILVLFLLGSLHLCLNLQNLSHRQIKIDEIQDDKNNKYNSKEIDILAAGAPEIGSGGFGA